MNSNEYILVPSTDIELVEIMASDYFNDEYISHHGISIEIGEIENSVVISFTKKIDNALFIFFYTSLTSEPKFYDNGLKGYFNASDSIGDYTHGKFDKDKENDSYKTRIMLTHEVSQEYTMGISNTDKAYKFLYSGEFEAENGEGFSEEPNLFLKYKKRKELHFSGKTIHFKTNKKGCLPFTVVLLITIELFSFLATA